MDELRRLNYGKNLNNGILLIMVKDYQKQERLIILWINVMVKNGLISP